MGLLDLLHRPFEQDADTALRLVQVPPTIETKLVHLVAFADRARAAQQALADEVRELRIERRDVTAHIERTREAASHRPRSVPLTMEERQRVMVGELREVANSRDPGPETIPANEARLIVIDRALERLAPQLEAGAARSDAAGRLADRCVEWTKPRSPADLEAAVARTERAMAGMSLPRGASRLTAALEATREDLRTLVAERATIEKTPVTLAEAKARVVAVLDGLTREWAFEVPRFFDSGYDLAYEDGSSIVPHAQNPDGLRAFVACLLRPMIEAAVMPLLEAEAARHEALLSAEARAQRLASIDGKLRTAWYREEALVCALEGAGVIADRREDADPEVTLTVAPSALQSAA